MNYLLGLFGASMAISISAAQLLAGTLIIVSFVLLFRGQQTVLWRNSTLLLPITVFAGWTSVAGLFTGSQGFWASMREFNFFLLYFLIAHGLSREKWSKAGVYFLMASTFIGFIGILQGLAGVNYDPSAHEFQAQGIFHGWPRWSLHIVAARVGRAVGFRSHPLTYAEGLLPAFLIVVGWIGSQLFQKQKPIRSVWWGLIGIVGLGGGIIFSQSRGVWLGLLMGFVYLIWNWPRKIRGFIIVGCLLLASGIFAFSPHYRARALSIFIPQAGSGQDQLSNAIRLELWRQSFEQIQKRPILGNGLDGTELVTIDPWSNLPRIWSESHNIYLQAALDGGLVGFGLFLWILFVAGRMIRSLPDPWKRVSMAVFIGFLVAGLTESWTHDTEVAMIAWSLMGFVERIRRTAVET